MVEVFGSDSFTPLFLAICVLLGLFQVRTSAATQATSSDVLRSCPVTLAGVYAPLYLLIAAHDAAIARERVSHTR